MKNLVFGNRRKKANITDIPYIAAMMFLLALIIIFGYTIMGSMNDEIQSNDKIPTIAKTANTTTMEKFLLFDVVYLIVWAVSLLGTLISAYFIETHPVFFVVFLIVLIFILVALIPISNLMEEIFGDAHFTTAINKFPIIMFYITHFFKIITAHAFLIMYVLYAKVKQ